MVSNGSGYTIASASVSNFSATIDIGAINNSNVDLPYRTITEIGNIFSSNGSDKVVALVIPSSVINIAANAFKSCINLNSITFTGPTQLKTIGARAFDSTGVNFFTISESVISIAEYAFNNCIGFNSIELLANSTVAIAGNVFAGCINLRTIVVPKGATTVSNTFAGSSFNRIVYLSPKASAGDVSILTTYYDPTQPGWTGSGATSLAVASGLSSLMNEYLLANGPIAYYPAFGITVPIWGAWIGSGTYTSTTTDGSNLVATLTLTTGNNYTLTSVTTFTEKTYIDIAAINASSNLSGAVITTIGSNAFSGSNGLVAINIPFGVTSIDESAFLSTSLLSVILPDSCTNIGNAAFSGCTMYSIVIPDSVTSVGTNAFDSCISLTSLRFPANITSIGNSTCSNCNKLQDIILPSNLTSIGDSAFSECRSLESIVLPSGINYLGNSVFLRCTYIRSLIIPTGVTLLRSSLFSECTNIRSITFPNNIPDIPAFSLASCTNLTSIAFPASITGIGDFALTQTPRLTMVVIPIATITGTNAFANYTATAIFLCPRNNVASFGGLQGIYYDPTQPGWGNGTSLANVSDGALSSFAQQYIIAGGIPLFYPKFGIVNPSWNPWVDISSGKYTSTSADGNLVATMTNTSGTIFELTSVRTNTASAFTVKTFIGINNIVQAGINIGTLTIRSIGNDAFMDCSGLAVINIPSTVITIGTNAFRGCTGLNNINLPSSINTIGSDAFNGCTGLTTIDIPIAVTTLAAQTFYNCVNLISIAAPGVVMLGESLFEGCSGLKTFILPSTLTVIPNGIFSNCINLTHIDIPPSVVSIGANAFSNCTSLATVKVPSSVTMIGMRAFEQCGFTFVNIPAATSSINSSTFSGCSNLKNINIPAYITTIGSSAFASCQQLQSVVIPTGTLFQDTTAFTNIQPTAVFLGPWADVSGSASTLNTVYYDPNQSGWADVSGPISLAGLPANTLNMLKAQYLAANGPPDYYPAFGITIPTWGQWSGSGPYTSTTTDGLLTATIIVSGAEYRLARIRTNTASYPFTVSTYVDIRSLSNAARGYPITHIGDSAFQGCTGLVAIAIPPTVTTISQNAFYGCTGLIAIIIPENVPSVGTGTFTGCSAATSVFLNPSFAATGVLGDLNPNTLYYAPTPSGMALAFGPPWPPAATSLADAVPYSLAFMAPQYIVSGGPAMYNLVFGVTVICYVKGTKILTTRGYVLVEDLNENDMVVSGGSIENGIYSARDRNCPIVWMGYFDAHGLDDSSKPICIKKDAFGTNQPFEDLYVSPGHSILVDGNLINADLMINGTTICRDDNRDNVTYYHIELDQHSTMNANGIAAESYKEDNNRQFFYQVKRPAPPPKVLYRFASPRTGWPPRRGAQSR